MHNAADMNIERLIERLDDAVLNGRVHEADELTSVLFRMQGGTDEIAVMPEPFIDNLKVQNVIKFKERRMKPTHTKKIIYIVAAAAIVTALSITAVATGFFGVRDLVIEDDTPVSASVGAVADGVTTPVIAPEPSPSYDMISMQGYPDSPEYKAAEEWSIFTRHYDEDGSIIAEVGNNPNEYTERYPLYLVYSKDMADKLEEIVGKYGLTLHESITIAENADALFSAAGTGDFLSGTGIGYSMQGGYAYDDGTFLYDGQVALTSGKLVDYQFGNYVKGTFSDVSLNVGDADSYREWQFETSSGVTVSLALGDSKALVITDLDNSFVVINVLTGTAGSDFGSSAITEDDLEMFADLFDFSVIN